MATARISIPFRLVEAVIAALAASLLLIACADLTPMTPTQRQTAIGAGAGVGAGAAMGGNARGLSGVPGRGLAEPGTPYR